MTGATRDSMTGRARGLWCAVAMAVLAASGGCDTGDDSPGAADTGQMWCGPLLWKQSGIVNAFSDQPVACFLIEIEAADGSGREVAADFADPIRVTYYTAFLDGGDCLIQGVDADGFVNGLSAVLDADAGDCSLPEQGAGPRVAQRWIVRSGNLTLVHNVVVFEQEGAVESAWSLRAGAEIARYVFDEANPDFGTAEFNGASMNHDGRAEADTGMLTWPDERSDPPCEVDGCYEFVPVGTVVVGDQYSGCRDVLAANQPSLISYSISEGGELSNDADRYVRIPGSCRFAHSADNFWRTILDYDTSQATVTFKGAPFTSEFNGVVDCQIGWTGALQSVPCAP